MLSFHSQGVIFVAINFFISKSLSNVIPKNLIVIEYFNFNFDFR